MTNGHYTLDTNILIGMAQRYPRDVFPSAWQALEAAIDEGRACICHEVLEETDRGSDDLYRWAKAYSGFVCRVTQEEVVLASQISAAHPDWVREAQNAADPFVIAHGSVHQRIIVTEEKRKGPGVEDRNQKIPNVADEFHVATLGFLDFARAENWKF